MLFIGPVIGAITAGKSLYDAFRKPDKPRVPDAQMQRYPRPPASGDDGSGGFDWSQLGNLIRNNADLIGLGGHAMDAYDMRKRREMADKEYASRKPLRDKFMAGAMNLPNLERPDLTWADPYNRHAQNRPRPEMPRSAFALPPRMAQ